MPAALARFARLATIAIVSCAAVVVVIAYASFDVSGYVLTHYRLPDEKTKARYYVPRILYTGERKIDVLLLGGSSVVETFYTNYDHSDYLTSACGTKLTVFNAGSSGQNIADSFAVLETVERRHGLPKVVVFGLTHYRLGQVWNTETDIMATQQLALPSPKLPVAMMPLPERLAWLATGPMSELKRLYELFRHGKRSDSGEFLESQYNYDMEPWPLDTKLQKSLVWRKSLERNLDQYAAKNADYIAKVIRRYQDKGVRFIFNYTPIAPFAWKNTDSTDEPIAKANVILEKVAPMIDLRKDKTVPENYFYDEQHFRPQARAAFWKGKKGGHAIATAICAALNKEAAE